MIFRFCVFLKIWLAITPQLWRAAFNSNAELTSTSTGFSITVKEPENND